MTAVRGVLGLLGVAVAAYGGWLLVAEQARREQLVSVLVWVAGGVVAHDFVLVPVVLVLLAVTGRLLPASWRAPAAVAFVVLGTVSVVAVPFLGRFGALSDNPTLLDRDYTSGYLALVAVVLAGVVLGALVLRSRRRAAPQDLSAPLDDDDAGADRERDTPGG